PFGCSSKLCFLLLNRQSYTEGHSHNLSRNRRKPSRLSNGCIESCCSSAWSRSLERSWAPTVCYFFSKPKTRSNKEAGLLQCMSLLLALSGHPSELNQCPLLG